MTEALPLAATALIPLAVFPLTGVLTPHDVAQSYGNALILLFLGGFILSRGLESTTAHRQLALRLVRIIGSDERRLVFGFMLSAALLSMWISNTATALMLLPMAMAITAGTKQKAFTSALLLAVAYGASIGGLGSPIGSPPNLVFIQVYKDLTGEQVGFLRWMSHALPVVFVLLPITGLWLTRKISSGTQIELPQAQRWTSAQVRTIAVFAITALAWMTRQDPWGGWSTWLNLPAANDASVALIGALALFIIRDEQDKPLLNWAEASKIPWGMLILFGGGIAIAKAFAASGLSDSLADSLAHVLQLPTLILLLLVCLFVTFLTEINSNTATAVLLLPVLGAAAIQAGMSPMVLMLPAALSASCAFMLPVATPPNAIVFGSGQLHISTMIRNGLALNLVGACIITAWVYWRTAA